MNAIVMLEGPDQRAQEMDAFTREFLRYAAMDDLSQPCPVGRLIGAPDKAREPIWHVVADAMIDKADFTHRAMRLLCGYAKFGDPKAAALLSDMAEHWAELRCDL
jgi:hypothetical protein